MNVPTVASEELKTHPTMKYTRHAICPQCGFEGSGNRENCTELQDFDVLGSDADCVFCNQCNTEIRL